MRTDSIRNKRRPSNHEKERATPTHIKYFYLRKENFVPSSADIFGRSSESRAYPDRSRRTLFAQALEIYHQQIVSQTVPPAPCSNNALSNSHTMRYLVAGEESTMTEPLISSHWPSGPSPRNRLVSERRVLCPALSLRLTETVVRDAYRQLSLPRLVF
jgi:hypothetical protein